MRLESTLVLAWFAALPLAGCGSDPIDDGDGAQGGEANTTGGASTGGASTGGATATGGSGAAAGSGAGGTSAGSGGMDPCGPKPCTEVVDCTPVAPQQALITDFSDLYEGDIFHSSGAQWWLEFFGGPYVYPDDNQCAANQPEQILTQDFSDGTWHITGTVVTYAGGGLWLAPCIVDMSAYSGISFTISGDVGPSGSIFFHLGTGANTPPSTNPAQPTCHPNMDRCMPADPEATWMTCAANGVAITDISDVPRTVTVLWEEAVGGMPDPTTDPADIRNIGITLDWKDSYTSADAYPVDITLDDFTLVE